MNKRLLASLAAKLNPGELQLDRTIRERFSGDKWFATEVPDAVAFPRDVQSVSRILAYASDKRIPVTPRGAGYGYVGGCVPTQGGIVLSLNHLKRIKEVHEMDFVAVVEPGVLTSTLQEAVEAKGLYYPPDPASRADCSIGGNIATNAGGPRCLKYGVTRDYVLGVEVVLADGTIVRLGGRTHKNKTGFELARLFVGSEGMLGIVTEATLKLLPFPPFRACLGIGFGSMKAATRAIHLVFASGFLPSALELADQFTLRAAAKRTGSSLLAECQAHLIIELDGQERSVRNEIAAVQRIVQQAGPVFVHKGWGAAGCESFWKLRREFSYALRDTGLTKLNEDVVVPRGRLEQLFGFTAKLQKKHRFPIACFGHAGDGNIHVNIMVDPTRPGLEDRQKAVLDELFEGIVAMDGAITGEHGIGLAKKDWWNLATSAESRHLHWLIKNALDPKKILNPGKFL